MQCARSALLAYAVLDAVKRPKIFLGIRGDARDKNGA